MFLANKYILIGGIVTDVLGVKSMYFQELRWYTYYPHTVEVLVTLISGQAVLLPDTTTSTTVLKATSRPTDKWHPGEV